MADYKKLYYQLFNHITDLIEELKKFQIEAEEQFMDDDADEEEEAE